MNACEYCGTPTMWAVCNRCNAARDPDLSEDLLVRACIDHPERVAALHQAFADERQPKENAVVRSSSR